MNRRSTLPTTAIVCLAAAALSACAAQHGQTHAQANERDMPCSQAARVASGALFRLGYAPESAEAPQPGLPGRIVGRKSSGWAAAKPEPGPVYTATVTVTCSNQGAAFDALTDEPLPGALSFKVDFAKAIAAVAARRTVRPELADRPASGLVISIEPLRSADASKEFGADLPAAGITPVRVTIDNRSDRSYGFAAERVKLVTQENDSVEPLAAGDAGKTTAAVQAAVRSKRIVDTTVAPHAVHSGFLYFPVSAYRRATLVLIDQSADEEEGFSVEF